MKRCVLFLLAFFSLSAELTRLPDEFFVSERIFSLTSTFDVKTEIEPFAVAEKRFFSLTSTFDLKDAQGLPLANASTRFFSWGTVADVFDPLGQKIGWIEEELFRCFSWAEYRVFNHYNQLAAVAKMNFWGTSFELSPPDQPHIVYATISRPFFRCCSDSWTVQIKDYAVFEEGHIDPRLLVLLAIYQTDKENRDRFIAGITSQILNSDD